MAKQIIEILKNTINASDDSVGLHNAEIKRNRAKEEIQYYVLNFIYHHKKYSNWTMYGGSALRICYDLNRMSVDLDFEIDHMCTVLFLSGLKKEVERYFADKYELESDMLTVKIVNGRGLLLRFSIGNELGIDHHSKQVHVKIDLNYFIPPKAVTERVPINHGQLSFVIKTYNMSTLMASKIAAILLRGTRRVGKAAYEEKGRDIYDLLWYMGQKIIPDLNYLHARAKNIGVTNLHMLFDLLTLQMSKVNNKNLQHDLSPLFLDQDYIKNWLAQWHESYLRLVKSYNMRVITQLYEITISPDLSKENYSFVYTYATKENHTVKIIYTISSFLFEDLDIKVSIAIDDNIVPLIRTPLNKKVVVDMVRRYATLFYKKNSTYLKKLNNIVPATIQTKTICTRMCNEPGMIMLDRKTLLTCELESLMK